MNTSSACPLRSPVERHWVKNLGRACPAIFLVKNIEAGTVTNAISVSNGEIVIIMIVTPTTVSRAVRIWLTLCCRLWARLSMSLVTLLSRSPRVWPST